MTLLAAAGFRRTQNAADFGKTAVLYGGDSSEREISLISGQAVLAALKERGVDAHPFDPKDLPLAELLARGFERVWIALHGPGGEDGSSYDDWEALDSANISYAGRDQVNAPIRGGNESEIIIASDDDQFGPNHKNTVNYLYADGSVRSFDIQIDGAEMLKEFPEIKTTGLPIGPDCPFEPLRVLKVD